MNASQGASRERKSGIGEERSLPIGSRGTSFAGMKGSPARKLKHLRVARYISSSRKIRLGLMEEAEVAVTDATIVQEFRRIRVSA